MIETAIYSHDPITPSTERELAANVWLKQDAKGGQYVEIILPPFELNDLLTECEQTFPAYAIQVLEVLAKNDPTALEPGTRLTPELTKGLFNTQVLGTVLSRNHIVEDRAVPILPELHQAFGLAMKGRLRLTADPLPDV